MLAAYLVALVSYVFAACAGLVLIYAVNHLDPVETERAAGEVRPQEVTHVTRELKLAS